MRTIRASIVALALVALAYPALGRLTASSLVAQGQLSQLQGMSELKSWFNAYKGHPRLIFLLSPT
jgi:hypothetical protein